MTTMDQQRVIMWLGVELAEKKSEIADLELEAQGLRQQLGKTNEGLLAAIDKIRILEQDDQQQEQEQEYGGDGDEEQHAPHSGGV